MLCQHITLVEDNQALREAMSLMLRLNHFDVTESDHLQNIFENRVLPDLYIIDYWLDDIKGGKICTLLKCHEQTQNIPVIVISADPTIEIYHVGADAFLPKPFTMKYLLELINYLVKPDNQK